MAFVKNPGTPIVLGGDPFVMPPLALGAIEQMGDTFTEIAKGEVKAENFGPLIDLIHVALKRNYPAMDRAVVADNLDLGNLDAVFKALMTTSGLVREVTVEETPPGEAIAVTAG